MGNLPKGFVYMGVAVVAGLIAMFAIRSYVARKTYVAPVATGPVAVATTAIAAGNVLAAGSVKIVNWPLELVPPQVASSVQQVQGRVVQVPIAVGEPINFSKLAPVGATGGLSSLLDPSKRALTVRVDDISGVAGFIHPQDKVDVLVDMRYGNESVSKTILQNILVLSIGQTWDRTDSKPKVVNAVTLELTPEQAEVLNLASTEGKIRLSLRGRSNGATVQTTGVATSALFAGMEEKKPEKAEDKPAVKAQPKPVERTVEVIKGLECSKTSL
jgi:pilus assembly protein CpaB